MKKLVTLIVRMRTNRGSAVLQRLIVPLLIDQFGHKRCQKKRKDIDYKL